MLKRFILISIVAFMGLVVRAQSSNVLFQYSQEDLIAMNANTLADLIQRMPGVSAQLQEYRLRAQLGGNDMTISAIYLDDLALFMDMNIPANYHSVSLHNVKRVEFRSPGFMDCTKGITSINVYMYTNSIHEHPYELRVRMAATQDLDGAGSGSVSLSNARHSFSLGFNKQFENGLGEEATNRAFDWASADLGIMNVRYHLELLGNSSLDLNYSINTYQSLGRQAIIEETSRSADQRFEQIGHRFGGKLKLQLSKTHRLEVNGSFALDDQYAYIVERDLSRDYFEIQPINSVLDSISNRFVQFKSVFVREDTQSNYSFNLGIEFTNMADQNVSSVNAIPVSYLDYALFGRFEYEPFSFLRIGAGLNFLSNSVLGSQVLPRFYLQIDASQTVRFKIEHLQSAIYPSMASVFYNAELTKDPVSNNIELPIGVFQTTRVDLSLHQSSSRVNAGVLFSKRGEQSLISNELETYTAIGENSLLYTYLSGKKQLGNWNLDALLFFKGVNAIAHTLDQYVYSSNANLRMAYSFPRLGSSVHLIAKMQSEDVRRFERAEGLVEVRCPSYTAMDMAFTQRLFQDRLRLTAGVSNVFDVYRLELTEYPLGLMGGRGYRIDTALLERGRRAFVQLNLLLK